MKNILDEINEKKRLRIEERKNNLSLQSIKEMAKSEREKGKVFNKATRSFYQALREDNEKYGISIIAEIKKASPSKGVISADFPYMEIAAEYENSGASCISCLTEEDYFLGSDEIFSDIAKSTTLPMLRKDFVVDIYQIYESYLLGASAVLLIMSSLEDSQVNEYYKAAEELGMDSIFEAHDEEEVLRAINLGARIIGLNNRNLKTFKVDLKTSEILGKSVPSNVLCISESGIMGFEDIDYIRKIGIESVLVGESLMKSKDVKTKLSELRGKVNGS